MLVCLYDKYILYRDRVNYGCVISSACPHVAADPDIFIYIFNIFEYYFSYVVVFVLICFCTYLCKVIASLNYIV
jgi:hypothetical protein